MSRRTVADGAGWSHPASRVPAGADDKEWWVQREAPYLVERPSEEYELELDDVGLLTTRAGKFVEADIKIDGKKAKVSLACFDNPDEPGEMCGMWDEDFEGTYDYPWINRPELLPKDYRLRTDVERHIRDLVNEWAHEEGLLRGEFWRHEDVYPRSSKGGLW